MVPILQKGKKLSIGRLDVIVCDDDVKVAFARTIPDDHMDQNELLVCDAADSDSDVDDGDDNDGDDDSDDGDAHSRSSVARFNLFSKESSVSVPRPELPSSYVM